MSSLVRCTGFMVGDECVFVCPLFATFTLVVFFPIKVHHICSCSWGPGGSRGYWWSSKCNRSVLCIAISDAIQCRKHRCELYHNRLTFFLRFSYVWTSLGTLCSKNSRPVCVHPVYIPVDIIDASVCRFCRAPPNEMDSVLASVRLVGKISFARSMLSAVVDVGGLPSRYSSVTSVRHVPSRQIAPLLDCLPGS